MDPTLTDFLHQLQSAGQVPADDDGLLTYAAIGAAHRFWRNTQVEAWHSERWSLDDGEMMRNNSAVVKIIRARLTLTGTDWKSIARQVTTGDRVLCDGRTLVEVVGRTRLRGLRHHAVEQAEALEAWQEDSGARTAMLAGALHAVNSRWHGSTGWPAQVERFCVAVDEPSDPHWRLQPLPDDRPADIAHTAELRRLLLVGPDTLSAEAARWCVERAWIGYI